MSLRALPLIIIAFITYNIIVLFGQNIPAYEVLAKPIFTVPMIRGTVRWPFTLGDMLILMTMVLLFIELIKSTYTSSMQMIDHGLSMLVFIACLVEFLLVDLAATSVFFFIMVAALIDVVAGALIGIRTARRDLNIGGEA